MRRALLLLGVVALLAGCGGGAEHHVSKAEFVAKADSICAAGQTEIARLAQPSTPQDLDEYLGKAIPIQKREVAEIRRLDWPDADKTRIERVLRAANDLIAAFEELRAAAHSGDQEAITKADKAAAQAGAKMRSAARAYGFKVCGGPS